MPRTASSASTKPVAETNSVSKEEYEKMVARTERLEEMLAKLLEEKSVPVTQAVQQPPTYYGNKMDTPCTLIHLIQCTPDLPTTINVRGVTHYFTSFGEKKTFTWADMSNIVSKYRLWFNRGVFALGEDCEQFKDELPSDIMSIKLPDYFYRAMANMPDDEFEKNISSLTSSQKAQVANTWRARYISKERGYDNIEKIRILNKATDGLLKNLISDISSKE